MKNKKNYIVIAIGLILIGIGFLIHLTNRYRLGFIILGLIIQIIGMSIGVKKKWLVVPIITVIFSASLVLIDYIFVTHFDKLPVIAYRQRISKKAKIYNAPLYRVWKCDISDDKMYIDKFYKSNFYCDSSVLPKKSINDFVLHFEKNSLIIDIIM